MRYTWNFQTVKLIADLEVKCFTSCINIASIRYILQCLKGNIARVLYKDEDLKDSFDRFEDVVSNVQNSCVKLIKIEEVTQV